MIKRIAPIWVLKSWFNLREFVFLRSNPDRHTAFASIYANNLWRNGESASGFGSTLEATREARAGLEQLVEKHGLESILDVPSGDFNWMRELRFAGKYTGGEIVQELAEANQRKYGNDRRRFLRLDVAHDTLPHADLVLCRECLNHLPLQDVQAALDNLIPAARRFLVITQYPDARRNSNQPASFRYRPLNFTLAPFGLRAPDHLIDETRVEAGKYLAIWDVQKEPIRKQD